MGFRCTALRRPPLIQKVIFRVTWSKVLIGAFWKWTLEVQVVTMWGWPLAVSKQSPGMLNILQWARPNIEPSHIPRGFESITLDVCVDGNLVYPPF